MSRLRATFTTAALLLALAALTFSSLAQPPGGGGGGGRGGRGGGPGGGFGGPGGGFGGPGGGSLLQLASNPAVQTDMKVTEKQKTQIKSLNDKFNAKMQEFWGQMGGPGGRGPGGGPQGPGGQGRARNGNGGNGQGADAQGGNGNGGGGGGGNRGNRGNRNQNGQGVPEDPEVVQQREEQRAMMREAMTELRQSAETSLGRIFDKAQVTRIKQIQLQLEGPNAVLREDMMEKLGIDEAQVEMIREIQGENRNLQRDSRRARGDVMKAAFARANPTPRNNNQDGGDDANGGNGGNGNNPNNGRNGGGRGGRGNFDPEAMRKVMESPEVKAQMEKFQGEDQKLSSQFAAAVNKVLTPRQKAMYKKMLGPPFDRSQMMGPGGPFGGGRGGFGPGGNQAKAKGAAAAKAKAADDDGDDETPKAKSASAAPAKAKATTARPKTLREQRGEPPADDN